MPDFGELLNMAKEMAGQHPDQLSQGLEALENVVNEKTGGKLGPGVEVAGGMLMNILGAHPSQADSSEQQDDSQQDDSSAQADASQADAQQAAPQQADAQAAPQADAPQGDQQK